MPFPVVRITQQAANYVRLIAWLLLSIFKPHKLKLISSIALAVLCLSGQAAAIFAIYWYARTMERTGAASLRVPSLDFALTDATSVLAAVVIFSVSSLALSALFLFYSRMLVLRIVEDYCAQAVQSVVVAADALPDPRAPTASRILNQCGVSGLISGCKQAAVTAVILASTIPSTIGGVAAAAALIHVDMPLTFSILAASCLVAIMLYPCALRGSSMAKFQEKSQAAFQQQMRGLQWSPSVSAMANPATSRDMARGYFVRRRVTNEFALATSIATTALLGLVLYYLAGNALAGRAEWAIVIVYIGALRLTLGSVAALMRAFANVSSCYPQLVRYYLFANGSQDLARNDLGTLQCGEKLALGTLPDGQSIIVPAGTRLALLTTQSVREVRYALLQASCTSKGMPLGSTVIGPATGTRHEASIAIFHCESIGEPCEETQGLDTLLTDRVGVFLHHSPSMIGAFGERYLLTLKAGTFRSFQVLGTNASDAELARFERHASTTRRSEQVDEFEYAD